jgi:hypothetical protein
MEFQDTTVLQEESKNKKTKHTIGEVEFALKRVLRGLPSTNQVNDSFFQSKVYMRDWLTFSTGKIIS